MEEPLSVWKTIELGTHKNGATLLEDLSETTLVIVNHYAGLAIADPAFPVARRLTSVDLVCVSLRDLGLTDRHYERAVLNQKAIGLGLALCPPEVAPQLALQCVPRDWLRVRTRPDQDFQIAMEPIWTGKGDRRFQCLLEFGISDISTHIRFETPNAPSIVSDCQRFIFIRPKLQYSLRTARFSQASRN